MRILYLNYGPQSGVTAAVLGRLRAAGHRVEVHDPVDGQLYKRQLGRWQVPNLLPGPALSTAAAMIAFGRHWRPWYLHSRWFFDRLSARCDRVIAALRPDAVLQAGCLFAPGRPGRAPTYLYCDHTRALHEAYASLPGLPPPVPFDPGWRRRETAAYRQAEGIFTMSACVRRSLLATYGVAPERVHVVGAGPNVEPAPGAAPGARAPAFLFVGRDFVPKGGPELLEAFAAVRRDHPALELWMVGGQQPPRAPPGVALLGPQPLDRVAGLMARASWFVLPTLREAFGLALLEAMSFGLPCVATAIEAIPEIVADGETGLLVPPRDPPALARALRALAEDPARAAAMGAAGRARVAARYGWDRAVGRMLAVMGAGARGGAAAQGDRRSTAPSSPAT